MRILIHNFLCNRSQRILANGDLSDELAIISGVPQGTVLGPLLFLILIDSLGDIDMDALVVSYCDDSKVSLTIENKEDAQLLQDCLDKLYQ